MNILVLSQYWAPENGIPQRRWSWLTKILVRAGHEVTVVAPPPHNERTIDFREWRERGGLFPNPAIETGPSGERIIRSGFFPAGKSLTQRAFNQASVAISILVMSTSNRGQFAGYKPDLVIGTVPALPTSVVTQLVAKRYKIPYIIDLRDAWPELLKDSQSWNKGIGKRSIREKFLSKGPFQLLSKITEISMNTSLQHANGIITTSEHFADHLRTQLHFGHNTPKVIDTVRNVFPPKTVYTPKDKRFREGMALNVLYAGTVGRAQKLDNAIRAVSIADERGYSVNLRILGDGAAWIALKELISETNVSATIEHRLPADDLYQHYDWADTALVHLTDWAPLARTIPSKTFELMSVGLHISAVVFGETAELIQELDAGDVVSPEDPEALAQLWIELINDRSKLSVSAKGRQWVEKQRNDIVPVTLLSIIEDVAQGRRG